MSESNGQKIEVLSEVQSEKPVKIAGADGTPKDYIVREMGGDQFTDWMQSISDRYKTDDKGNPINKATVKQTQEEAVEMISMCLFDELDNPVSVERIRKWPPRTRSRLADLCQEVNGLKAGKE